MNIYTNAAVPYFLSLLLSLGCGAKPAQEGGASARRGSDGGSEAHAAEGHGHDEGEEAHADHEEEQEGGHSESVSVTPGQMKEVGITLQVAGPGTVDSFVELPGEVRPNGDRLAHIVPRFPGIVTRVEKNIGDQVRAGETLAVVESDNLAPYKLTTLIDGTILEKHLTLGEAIDREKGAFVVADLGNVWVDLAVYQKDLRQLAVGQRVRLEAAGEQTESEAQISYITPTVDAPTRTATARVVLPNASGLWRPGMFVTARVLEPAEAELVVPLSAVQTYEGETVVFVESKEGFEPRKVSLGQRGETQVAVLGGLEPGERYVAQNSFYLKAELGKGEAEHDH